MKRIVALLFGASLILAGCSSDGADTETSTSEQTSENVDNGDTADGDGDEVVELAQGESVLESVREAGVVRVGVRNDNPPVSFLDEDGEWVGFDLDLAEALADELGVELELVPVDGTTRISFLESGQVDMSVASMNHTRSRDEAIDFSITYFWDNQSFLVRTGEYESIDQLFGETVAASAGSSTIDSWTQWAIDNGGEAGSIEEFEDKLAAVEAVRSGAVEGYTEDNITMLSLAAGDPNLTLLPGGHNRVQFGVGVPENDSEWRDAVNLALQDVWTSGEFQELYDPWFVDEATRVIDLPLGGEMEIWG